MPDEAQADQPISESDLRETLGNAETHLHGALVSAFDQLARIDQARAGERLLAVDGVFGLGNGLRRDGRPTPESRYFAAAVRLAHNAKTQPLDHETVFGQMVANGAPDADQRHLGRHLLERPDSLTGRQFETYAAACLHLYIARQSMSQGSRLSTADTTRLKELAEYVAAVTKGRASEDQATEQEQATEEDQALTNGIAPGSTGSSRAPGTLYLLGAGAGLAGVSEVASQQLGAPPGVGSAVVAFCLLAGGALVKARTSSGNQRDVKQRRTAAQNAAAALGDWLDATHVEGPLRRYSSPAAGQRPRPAPPPGAQRHV